jgi:hypothetical protein
LIGQMGDCFWSLQPAALAIPFDSSHLQLLFREGASIVGDRNPFARRGNGSEDFSTLSKASGRCGGVYSGLQIPDLAHPMFEHERTL